MRFFKDFATRLFGIDAEGRVAELSEIIIFN